MLRSNVFEFLAPIDPSGTFYDVGQALVEAAKSPKLSKSVAEAVDAVHAYFSDVKNPVLTTPQRKIYDQVRKRRVKHLAPGAKAPDFAETLVVAIYLRAQAALSTSGGKGFLDDLGDNLLKVKPALKKMKPDFFGELLIEIERRAGRSPEFAGLLENTAKDLKARGGEFDDLEEGWTSFLARKKNNDDECECIVSGCNDVGDCQNFCIDSWWECFLILIGIILIIILTA
jgi:hypothetical protein